MDRALDRGMSPYGAPASTPLTVHGQKLSANLFSFSGASQMTDKQLDLHQLELRQEKRELRSTATNRSPFHIFTYSLDLTEYGRC